MAGWDPIVALNLVLCVVIMALGYLGSVKRKNKVPLYIGIAFGFFAISHIMTLLAVTGTGVTEALVAIRLLGYLTVIFALYSLWKS